jgi:hypothetical protein
VFHHLQADVLKLELHLKFLHTREILQGSFLFTQR